MESFFVFLLTCLIIELTPGPNMGYLTVLSLTAGRRAGLATVAGVAAGLLTIGLFAALGVAEIVAASPIILRVIHYTGVFYLLWLAWKTWRDPIVSATNPGNAGQYDQRFFRRGFITNVLNAKAFAFYVIVLPGFLDEGHAPLHAVALTLVSVIIATLVHAGIVLLASRMQPFITHGSARRRAQGTAAFSLVLVAFWMAFL